MAAFSFYIWRTFYPSFSRKNKWPKEFRIVDRWKKQRSYFVMPIRTTSTHTWNKFHYMPSVFTLHVMAWIWYNILYANKIPNRSGNFIDVFTGPIICEYVCKEVDVRLLYAHQYLMLWFSRSAVRFERKIYFNILAIPPS